MIQVVGLFSGKIGKILFIRCDTKHMSENEL